ncbi:MAG: transporter substrate-binding domain-containing protein [Burkholderiaceae bacterium]
MKPPFPIRFPRLHALAPVLAFAALGALCTAAAADNLARARQRGQLAVGIEHVTPPYRAGAKFRTPEGVDQVLAEDLGRRLQLTAATRAIDAAGGGRLLADGGADLLLLALADGDPLHRNATVIPTGYSAAPMAIMRTDTTIKNWTQLKGRIVCVAEGGRFAGWSAAKYGAIEQRYKAPADALLALRIGECDAAVHDSALLEELIKLPEWKKFSARLPTGPKTPLVLVAPRGDPSTARFLKQAALEWRAANMPNQVLAKAVRNIAFEVYLDQNVPDCH